MNTRHHHSDETVMDYRTVARKADGRYIVIAVWSAFDKALGCCYGFYAAEKFRYDTAKTVVDAPVYSAEYFSVYVQRRDPSGGHNSWITVTQTLLRLDFDCEEKMCPKRRSLKSGDLCEAVLLERKTNKGGWIAKIPDIGFEGPVTNTHDVPSGMQPGTTVKLKIGAVNKESRRIQFTWPNGRKS